MPGRCGWLLPSMLPVLVPKFLRSFPAVRPPPAAATLPCSCRGRCRHRRPWTPRRVWIQRLRRVKKCSQLHSAAPQAHSARGSGRRAGNGLPAQPAHKQESGGGDNGHSQLRNELSAKGERAVLRAVCNNAARGWRSIPAISISKPFHSAQAKNRCAARAIVSPQLPGGSDGHRRLLASQKVVVSSIKHGRRARLRRQLRPRRQWRDHDGGSGDGQLGPAADS